MTASHPIVTLPLGVTAELAGAALVVTELEVP